MNKKQRSLEETIEKILVAIPDDEPARKVIADETMRLIRKSYYRAPDCQADLWLATSMILSKVLGIEDTEWKKKVALIMADKDQQEGAI